MTGNAVYQKADTTVFVSPMLELARAPEHASAAACIM